MKFENTFIKLQPEDQTVERIREIAEKYSKASGYPVDGYLKYDFETDWEVINCCEGLVKVCYEGEFHSPTEITEQDLDNYLQQMEENFNSLLVGEGYKDSDTDMENCKTSVEESNSDIPPVTEWKCFQQVAEVLGEENAEYELGKVLQQYLEGGLELDTAFWEDGLIDTTCEYVGDAFDYYEAPQGGDFWDNIDNGNLPENYHTTPDVLPSPACDNHTSSSQLATEVLAESLGVSEEELTNKFKDKLLEGENSHTKSIGQLIEEVYLRMIPSGVCITLSGDGTILLHGEDIPTVDVSKLEAEDIDKAYEALVMLEGLFVEGEE